MKSSPSPFLVIAGPCALADPNDTVRAEAQRDFFDTAAPWLFGVRVVGYKSRTEPLKEAPLTPLLNLSERMLLNFPKDHPKKARLMKAYYGIDVFQMLVNHQKILQGAAPGSAKLKSLPSVELCRTLQKKYPHLCMATEIIDPLIQLPLLKKSLRPGSVLAWTPAVDQLGPTKAFYQSLLGPGNRIAVKNPKWIGAAPEKLSARNISAVPGIKTWLGQASWLGTNLLIHRGFETEEKKNHRALPLHQIPSFLKKKFPALQIWFDPSHALGEKNHSKILEACYEAKESGLYDGLLVEVSDSTVDSAQHLKTRDFMTFLKTLKPSRG